MFGPIIFEDPLIIKTEEAVGHTMTDVEDPCIDWTMVVGSLELNEVCWVMLVRIVWLEATED